VLPAVSHHAVLVERHRRSDESPRSSKLRLLRDTGLQVLLLLGQPRLLLVHLVKDVASVELASTKGTVEEGRGDLEGNVPAIPETAEEVEDNGGLHAGAAEGCDGGY